MFPHQGWNNSTRSCAATLQGGVECKDGADDVKHCIVMEVNRTRQGGRPRTTRWDCVKEVCRKFWSVLRECSLRLWTNVEWESSERLNLCRWAHKADVLRSADNHADVWSYLSADNIREHGQLSVKRRNGLHWSRYWRDIWGSFNSSLQFHSTFTL